MKTFQILQYGDSSTLILTDTPVPSLKDDELLIKTLYTGINFIDIYFRKGTYRVPTFPAVLGSEAIGIVEKVGDRVSLFKKGDLVANVKCRTGTYAEYYLAQETTCVRIPKEIDPSLALSSLLQGLTVQYLVRDTFPLASSHKVLFLAGAGGVGEIFIQVAKKIGAFVLSTASTDKKIEKILFLKADVAINYACENFHDVVMRQTNNQGVDVVYDSVGKPTFEKSLKCVKKRGLLVSFGQSGGKIPPFDISSLSTQGSIFLTRPSLFDYVDNFASLTSRSNEVLSWIKNGVIKERTSTILPYTDAPSAHEDLEKRKTTGKILLKW